MATTVTKWPTKQKIFAIWPFSEEVANPCSCVCNKTNTRGLTLTLPQIPFFLGPPIHLLRFSSILRKCHPGVCRPPHDPSLLPPAPNSDPPLVAHEPAPHLLHGEFLFQLLSSRSHRVCLIVLLTPGFRMAMRWEFSHFSVRAPNANTLEAGRLACALTSQCRRALGPDGGTGRYGPTRKAHSYSQQL